MGVYSGPDLKEDGLILALDAGNYKNSRSSVSTNLVSNGSFANGAGSPNESGSNPTNTIVQLENPGETPFVLRQNGNNTEYQLNISGLTASTTYVMSGWYAKSSDYNGSDVMFHARAFSSSGANIATGTDTGTLLRSITLGSTTWEYRYQTIATPSDSTGYMEWYLGYGTNNTTGYRYYTNLKIEKGTFPSLLNMVGDSNHGTPTNGLSYSSANGGSLVFDGTDDFISITKTSQFDFGTSDFTIETFCNLTSKSSSYPCIFSNYSSYGSGAIYFGYEHDAVLSKYSIHVNGTGYLSSSSNVTYNVWTHLTLVRLSGVLYFYINGVLNGTPLNMSSSLNGNGSLITIGKANDGSSSFTHGKIANFKIYNRALTAAEIQQNFNALRGRFGI